jgi:putative DNA primase/helicase
VDAPTDGSKTINRAGFRRANEQGETEYFMLPEVFRREMCKGLDPRFVANLLLEQGLLIPEADSRPTRVERLPGMGKARCYRFRPRPNVLGGEK